MKPPPQTAAARSRHGRRMGAQAALLLLGLATLLLLVAPAVADAAAPLPHQVSMCAAHTQRDLQQCLSVPWYHSSLHSSSSMGSCAAAASSTGPAAAPSAAGRQPLAANDTTSSSTGAGGADAPSDSSRTSSNSSSVGVDGDEKASSSSQVYIVRFSEYRMLGELKALLTQALSSMQQHWSWVHRDNAAVRAHPTDFALLAVEEGHIGTLQQLLLATATTTTAQGRGDSGGSGSASAASASAAASLLGFRDCHPDRRIRGSSSWQPEGPLAAAFSDSTQNLNLMQGLKQGQGQQQGHRQYHPGQLRQPPSALRMAQEQQQQEEQPASVWSALAAGAAGLQAMMPSKQLLADNDDAPTGEGSNTQQQNQQQQQSPVPAPAPSQQQQDGSSEEQQEEGSSSIWSVSKPPGRMSTSHTIGLDPNSQADREAGYNKDELRRKQHRRRGLLGWAADLFMGGGGGGGGDSSRGSQERKEQKEGFHRRRKLQQQGDTRVTSLLEAPVLWKQGYSGKGIKVGVFDTGIREGHPHIRNIVERTNWTHQQSLADGLGHGSFVAGVIGSQDDTCPGFAPDMQLYTFKVFTDDQVSYTSWFLDAFNHAIASRLHIINLSIGGPDFLDQPFVDKVLEVTSNGLIMISAIGNDGPLYGTLNNPADQPDVIGVGGIDNDNHIAQFSSRGMTTWELPTGTGRIKPDVMAYGKDVSGSKITSGCRSLSGTSVASPVVAGAATLLASTLPEDKRWLLNPGSLKQALVEGAVRLPDLNMYEQGNGRINLPASAAILAHYEPRASIIPRAIDFTDCPYMWPYCAQPLYAFGLPVAFNATIVNGMAVTAQLAAPPVFTPTDEGGRLLHVSFQYSEVIWPWSGYLALFIEVTPGAWNYSGIASGNVTFHVQSPPQYGTKSAQMSIVSLPLRVKIIPTPPRSKRVVWDVLHSIKYPPGYVPRDNLDVKSDVLDWHGDHPFTNFHDTLNALRGAGYFVEILSSPSTCFHPGNYGAYLAMDSEEEWYTEEVSALSAAVKEHGMALIVFAEWYHLQSLRQMKFFDDNTRSWWTPITGGANVPALNDLLAPHNITLGERILTGTAQLGKHKVTVLYGANIAKFPAGGYLHITNIADASGKNNPTPGDWAPFGVAASGKGHVAVLGDTNCLDSSHMVSPCHEFVKDLLHTLLSLTSTDSTNTNTKPPTAGTDAEGAAADAEDTPTTTTTTPTPSSSSLMSPGVKLQQPYTAPGFSEPPQRRSDINFTRYSWVLQHPAAAACSLLPTAPCQYRGDCPKGDKAWEHKTLVAGQEPPDALVALRQQDEEKKKAEAAAKAAEQDAAAAREAEAAAAAAQQAAAAAAAAAAQQQQQQEAVRTVQTDGGASSSSSGSVSGGTGVDLQDSVSGQAEAVQQQQRRAFVSQAASWGTLICIAGLMGLVVLWQMRAPPSNGGSGVGGRRWGRYAAVGRRPPSPGPPGGGGDRMV